LSDYPSFRGNQLALFAKRRAALNADLGALESARKLIREELEMNLPLLQTGDVSKAEVIKLQRQMVDIQAQIVNRRNKYLQDTQAELVKAQEDLAAAEQMVAQRREQLDFTELVAPMDGVVLTKNVEIGESITSGVSSFNAGTVLFTVADTSRMIVKAGVNEVDIGKIRVSMPVRVTLDAYPKVVFNGRIDRIAPAVRVDEKVRVFDVEIRLDAQGRELRSGMTANIEVIGEKKEKVLSVPVESVFKRDDQEVVYVKKAIDPKVFAEEAKKSGEAKNGKKDKDAWKKFFDRRTIVTGLADNARVEIVSGLKPGEEVAIEDPTVSGDKKEDNDD
nr:efflux RND transporter periplasmic adaptor subunit [Acidobacteriota bacterium]